MRHFNDLFQLLRALGIALHNFPRKYYLIILFPIFLSFILLVKTNLTFESVTTLSPNDIANLNQEFSQFDVGSLAYAEKSVVNETFRMFTKRLRSLTLARDISDDVNIFQMLRQDPYFENLLEQNKSNLKGIFSENDIVIKAIHQFLITRFIIDSSDRWSLDANIYLRCSRVLNCNELLRGIIDLADQSILDEYTGYYNQQLSELIKLSGSGGSLSKQKAIFVKHSDLEFIRDKYLITRPFSYKNIDGIYNTGIHIRPFILAEIFIGIISGIFFFLFLLLLKITLPKLMESNYKQNV